MKKYRIPVVASLLLIAATISLPVQAAQTATTDSSGKSDIGVDISKAGNTQAQQKQFVASATHDDQIKIKRQCLVIVGEAAEHTPEVVGFCKNVSD
jgi:hypothetical protein